jgi:hypothetical protein
MAISTGVKRPRVKRITPKYIKKKNPIILNEKKTFICQWCKHSFSSESRVVNHLCEQRRRFQQKDTQYARWGLEAYFSIQKHFFGNVSKTEEDFRHSEFYLACIRWGRFVLQVDCLNATAYLNWLQKLNVSIDKWDNEIVYSAWLQSVIFEEDLWDATYRSIQTMIDWAEENKKEYKNYFKLASSARILLDLQRAKISAIIIYSCNSGIEWLKSLPQSDLNIIWDMINPARWKCRFEKLKEIKQQIEDVCNEIGL